MAACAEKMPAQPQAASFVCRACGALSVPRKKRASSLVAASISALPIALALQHGQAVVVRTDAALEDRVAIQQQVLRRDGRRRRPCARCLHELHGFARRHVLEHDAQPRKALDDRRRTRSMNTRSRSNTSTSGVGDFAVHLEHAGRTSSIASSTRIDVLDRSDAGVGMRRRAGRIELRADDEAAGLCARGFPPATSCR